MRIIVSRRRRPSWHYSDGSTRPYSPWIRFGIMRPVPSIRVYLIGPLCVAVIR